MTETRSCSDQDGCHTAPRATQNDPKLIVTVKNTSAVEWEELCLNLQSTKESTVREDGGTMTQEGGRALVSSLARKACGDTTGVER